MSEEDNFDFTAPLDGPRNIVELEKMMTDRGIANDDTLEFNEDFVEQFYNDGNEEPGETCMFNGEPCIWGFIYWQKLYLMAYYYPLKPNKNVKRATYQTIDAFRYILPCKNCTRHFRKTILEVFTEKCLDSRESFLEFVIELRNSVDTRLGKEPFDFDAYFKRILAAENVEKPEHNIVEEPQIVVAAESYPTLVTKKNENMQETLVVNRHNMQSRSFVQNQGVQHLTPSVSTTTTSATTTTTRGAPQITTSANGHSVSAHRTNYGHVGRQVPPSESLKTVRDALRRNNLNNQQKANMQKLARSKTAKGVEKPGECKTCGGKPKKPSVF